MLIRRILLFALLALGIGVAAAGKTSASGPVHVSGYTKANGTVVAPYYRRAPGAAVTSSPYTAPIARTFSSCADARAAGRWNILSTDADYSPTLDRDHDDIACEAGSDGSSTGRDPDPQGVSLASQPDLTYPQLLAASGRWLPQPSACASTAAARLTQQSTLPGSTAALRTYSYVDLSTTPAAETVAIDGVPGIATLVIAPWASVNSVMTQTATAPIDPGVMYTLEVLPFGLTSSAICISGSAMRP